MSQPNLPVEYYTGVLDMYVALITQEDTATAAPVYSDPEILARSIAVTITPTYREGKLHASNAAVRNERRIDTYGVSFNGDKIERAMMAKIMNRRTDANGVQIISGSSKPPLLAIGFAVTLDMGGKEYWWLYKGTFSELTKTANTENENIEYQTPTIEGTFVRRINDNSLAAVVEARQEELSNEPFASWFTKVYEPVEETGEPETP